MFLDILLTLGVAPLFLGILLHLNTGLVVGAIKEFGVSFDIMKEPEVIKQTKEANILIIVGVILLTIFGSIKFFCIN